MYFLGRKLGVSIHPALGVNRDSYVQPKLICFQQPKNKPELQYITMTQKYTRNASFRLMFASFSTQNEGIRKSESSGEAYPHNENAMYSETKPIVQPYVHLTYSRAVTQPQSCLSSSTRSTPLLREVAAFGERHPCCRGPCPPSLSTFGHFQFWLLFCSELIASSSSPQDRIFPGK